MQEKITWEAHEHRHREKGNEWYWSVSIISLAIIVSAILLRNYFFAIFVAVGSFTLMMYAYKRPRIVKCEINKKGVFFERYFFPYQSLKSFWIDENLPEPSLIIQTNKFLMPYLVISLANIDHSEVRQFISKYLEEEELHEPIFQKIFEMLGF